MTVINFDKPLRWEVADATALAAQAITEAEVGYLCRKIDDNTIWRAVKAGSGATCWRLKDSNYRDGLASVALTDGADIAWDMSQGNLYHVTLAGNRNLSAPTNATPGKRYLLKITQDATGSRTITLNAVFLSAGGASGLTATAAHSDWFIVTCITSSLFLVQIVLDVS